MNATLESVLSFEGNDTNGTLMDRYDPVSTHIYLRVVLTYFSIVSMKFVLICERTQYAKIIILKLIEMGFFPFARKFTVHFSYS